MLLLLKAVGLLALVANTLSLGPLPDIQLMHNLTVTGNKDLAVAVWFKLEEGDGRANQEENLLSVHNLPTTVLQLYVLSHTTKWESVSSAAMLRSSSVFYAFIYKCTSSRRSCVRAWVGHAQARWSAESCCWDVGTSLSSRMLKLSFPCASMVPGSFTARTAH
jgi:hypothetical protein